MGGLLESKRWDVLPQDGKAERLLCERLSLSPLVARVLCARGIKDVDEAKKFISPSLDRDWEDPLDIPGMDAVARRLESALANGQTIAVFGDFDVDGMTSTCLLTQALRELGGNVHPFIPHRFGEGYGLSHEALDRVITDCHPHLIVTVDNGIAAAKEVAWLLEQGIDVAITDHHEPGDLVPQHVPVTDPKLSRSCKSRELAGAGVALKLVHVLGRRLGAPDLWKSYIDLAAMGTVSDMMLLQGENRSLVAAGIEQMRASTRPGIVALAASAGYSLTSITSDNLPFSLIPRLNAAGRMGTTETAFDLLISEDPAEAAVLAASLETTNTLRRETESRLSEEAIEHLKQTYNGERVIVVAGEGWHEGVKGIVASRIVGIYHVPTLVFTIENGIARGSGRSVGSVDLFHAVEQCADVLVRFGGHAGAVGVTCEQSRLEEFGKRLREVIDELPEEEFEDRGEVTTCASLNELGLESIGEIEVLQPFGQGNKRPLFGVRGVFMRNRARVGYGANHLRFIATDGVSALPAIMFRTPDMSRAYAHEGLVDLVVDAISETWQGKTQAKLMVRDILYRDATESQQSDAYRLDDASGDSRKRKDGALRPAALGRMSQDEVTDYLRHVMIGDHAFLPAQQRALELLEQKRSTLCVMATGRGKSLIFHVHAARMALLEGQASIFVYPLRALVSDQSYHLESTFDTLGLSVRVLTGESSQVERDEVFGGLRTKEVDVVLTTPEFLAIHSKQFARSGRIGFVVVDEAHHAGVARSGVREAYTEFDRVLHELGNPVTLAVTATAPTHVAREICGLLSIREEDVVVDASVRRNLFVVDHRDLRERDMYLASIVSSGEKTVVYVNSRDQAVALVRDLRMASSEFGERISYYHAGLSRELRRRIEDGFRGDELSCIVSTSAFGEGVNLPGIRNVVMYHMPFGSTEFNQMSGRAGRDGEEARIYLLFGSRDAQINKRLLASSAPRRSDLVALYRALRVEQRRYGTDTFGLANAELLTLALAQDKTVRLDESAVSSGIAVFDELGFLNVVGFGEQRRIVLSQSPEHAKLESSIRYREGLKAFTEFAKFRDWVLSATQQEILGRINRPIVPGFGMTVDC